MLKSKDTGLLEDQSPSARGVLAFFFAAALGMGFIVVAKLTSLNQFQVTVIPIIILLGYAYVLFRWRRMSLRDDQSGDNLYYLGFLYTLTSIAVSLYQFNLNEGVQEQVITNFGIAIFTTIVGLALRVMFNQMRQDPAEVERVARLELAEAARLLRREIDTVVMELNVFQRTIQQSITDNQQSLQEAIAGSLKASSEKLAGLFNAIRDELDENIPALAKQVSSLSKSTMAADKALGQLSEHLANLKTPELLVEVKLGPQISKIQSLLEEAEEAQADHIENISAVVVSMEAAAKAMRDSAQTIADFVDGRALGRVGREYNKTGWKRAFAWLGRRTQN